MDRNVEYILEVARCGGITRAAENLFITPSALSKYVIALEDQLQVKLFHRIGKSFVPTKAGEYYIRRCMEIEQIYQDMGQEMESIACISRRILRLGVQPNLAERVLRFVLPKLQERLPGIRISMHETISDHGGILYHSIYLNPDHVQPGNLYHLYSTGGFRLCEDRY